MNQAEARRHVAEQIGVGPVQLSALLDSVNPTNLAAWTYITDQIGHTSPQELREMCMRLGAFSGEQS